MAMATGTLQTSALTSPALSLARCSATSTSARICFAQGTAGGSSALLRSFDGLRVTGAAVAAAADNVVRRKGAAVQQQEGCYRGLVMAASTAEGRSAVADEAPRAGKGVIETFLIDPKAAGVVDVARGKGASGKVRIRLHRFGRKKLPFYRIFVADSRCRRDGKHLEIVGHYNPLPDKDGMKKVGVNKERIKYWLSVGAQPTDTVRGLLIKAGVISPSQ